ncbi:hypothetical protein P171DRAFT_505453 [Karstenula rhodostoma CBS 690.94]|uniref:Uncharacterized protein n=1 Tax=Karstenula rhodostoma CBS 690.94 TaxID=1392251 RepID=A0A9P4P5P6_9PLEO|nr:hypothetical protein P171DRAFT_505453 [Karstenula rhodostoma CBS 690.94]
MPSDARRSIHGSQQAMRVLRAMVRTRSHSCRREGASPEAASKECTRLGTCTQRCRLAGGSVESDSSYFAGVKQAEAVGQSLAKGAAGATAEPRTLKQQGVSATESLALIHPLTGFAGDIPAASASASRVGRPARGHGQATGRQHMDNRRRSSNALALKSHQRSTHCAAGQLTRSDVARPVRPQTKRKPVG